MNWILVGVIALSKNSAIVLLALVFAVGLLKSVAINGLTFHPVLPPTPCRDNSSTWYISIYNMYIERSLTS